MIAFTATLISTLLSTGLIAALSPILFAYSRKYMIWGMLLTVLAFWIETLGITYFYINGGSVSCSFGNIGFIDLHLELEPLGLVFLNLLAGLWLISILYSFFFMRAARDIRYVKLTTFLGLAIFIASIIAMAGNLFMMFIFYELLTLVTIPLVAHYGMHNPSIMLYIRILTFSSIAFFLPAIILINTYFGNTNFDIALAHHDIISHFKWHLLVFLIIFGIAKTAIFPLSNWLPAAMVAPYPVSALLHAVAVVKAGIFCLIKIIIYIFGIEYLHNILASFNWPLYLAIFTMLFASYKAITHDAIKNILAYSTISQLALILVAVFIMTKKAMLGAIAQMISHSFAKIALFFIAGRFYTAVHASRIEDLKGLGYLLPTTTIFFIISSLSLLGLPPFAGSYSKNLILTAINDHEYSNLIYSAVILSTIATAIYSWKIISVLLSEPTEKIYIASEDPKSIFRSFHLMNNRAMEISIGLICVATTSFPIVEKFLNNILWSIL